MRETEDLPAGPPLAELVSHSGPPSEVEALRIVSGVLYLAARSPLHESYGPGVLRRRIEPALALGQFHYHINAEGLPLAFCNWAWIDRRTLDEIAATGRDLEPAEFRSGDLPFFYEFLAPFGHARFVVRALRARPEFVGRAIPAIRGRRPDGGALVKTFHF